MLTYHSFGEIAGAVKAILDGLGCFRAIDIAAVSDYRQLLECGKLLASSPKALITIGNCRFDRHGMIRRFALAIVVFAPFRAAVSDKADCGWDLVQAVTGALSPRVNGRSTPEAVTVCGDDVELELTSFEPMAGDGKSSAWVVEIECAEAARFTGE